MIHPFFLPCVFFPPFLPLSLPCTIFLDPLHGLWQVVFHDCLLTQRRSSYCTVAIGHSQQQRELKGGAAIRKMGDHPTVSLRTTAGHLFILLFARRQCSRLWRRNSISILSLTAFLSPLHIIPPFCWNYSLLLPSLLNCFPFLLPLFFPISFLFFPTILSLTAAAHTLIHTYYTHKNSFFVSLASGTVVWVNLFSSLNL